MHARSRSTAVFDDLAHGVTDQSEAFLRPRTPTRRHSRQSSFHAQYLEVSEKAPILWNGPENEREELSHEGYDSKSKTFTGRRLTLLWALSLVVTCLGSVFLTRAAYRTQGGGFERGYATDLAAARSAIRVSTQQFHGSPDFQDRHFIIPEDDPSNKYVGSTASVDAEWDKLSRHRYFLLSDEEALAAYGTDPSKYWNVHHGGYVAGLDVMHTLHCLNHLRMSLYPDVYPQDPVHAVMHNAHCVDHLRQLAMCHSDLTPVPTQWFEGISRNYINSSRPHTCRDFSEVRRWANERYNGKTAVKARNRDGSPRAEAEVPWSP